VCRSLSKRTWNFSFCCKLDCLVDKLCDGLKTERTNFPKTIVFCKSCQDCGELYIAMIEKLGRNKTEPSGYSIFFGFQLTQGHPSSLSRNWSCLCLGKLSPSFATTIFSMGIDIPDIWQVYHW